MRSHSSCFHSTTWNGPVPITGGSLVNLRSASSGEIFDQMCSGRIGTHICSIVAFGFSVVKTTV